MVDRFTTPGIWACTLGVAAALFQTTSLAYAQDADAIYHNGAVYTVNQDQPWAEAVALKDGKFLSVGSNEDVLALAGPDTKKIDLGGQMAMPGMHDSHFHLFAVTYGLDCTPFFFKPEQLKEVLESCKEAKVPGYPWMIINGMEMWHAEELDNALLNEVFPETPVIIRDVTNHTRLVNDKALEIAGIDRNTPQPDGGVIQMDPETGEPTGVLAELGAIALVRQHIPNYPSEVLNPALTGLMNNMLSFGITSTQEAFILEDYLLTALGDLDNEGTPIPYIQAHLGWSAEEGPMRHMMDARIVEHEQYNTAHITADGVKVLLDGVPVPPLFTHVPLDENGEIDETNLLVPQDLLAQKMIEWDNAGLRVKLHAAAEGSVRVALNAIEATRKANGDSGIRHDVAHTSDVSPVDMPRFAEINAVAEMSPYFWTMPGLGDASYKFRTLADTGALITVGSDFPNVQSLNPFPPLQGILEHGEESLTLDEAIAALTLNAAVANNSQESFGSIEEGKVANMVIVDRNLFEIPSSEVGEARVVTTILDGQEVYTMTDGN